MLIQHDITAEQIVYLMLNNNHSLITSHVDRKNRVCVYLCLSVFILKLSNYNKSINLRKLTSSSNAVYLQKATYLQSATYLESVTYLKSATTCRLRLTSHVLRRKSHNHYWRHHVDCKMTISNKSSSRGVSPIRHLKT